MKKLIALFTIILTGIGFASCTGVINNLETELQQMSSKESLATLSYLSSGFLSLEEEPQLQTTKLSVKKMAVVEDELEDVNKYVTLLKSFINNGPDAFASVEDQESDRPEYDYLLNMSVNDNEFKLYYNVNIESREINGIFIIDGVEYEIIASSNLDDFEDFDQVTTEEPVTEEDVTTEDEVSTEEATSEATETMTETLPVFTLEEVSQNTGENGTSAYMVVNGVVYDITGEFTDGQHEGIQIGGTDATATFESSPHSASILDLFEIIGSLEGYDLITVNNINDETTEDNFTSDEDDQDDEDDEDEFDDEDEDEFDDEDDFDDEDEFEDEDENEVKKEMSLVARNGEDTITIKYEFKLEEDEEKTEFEIIKNINGVESIIEVEIKIEEDEYKLEIRDGNNTYEFSMETEDDEVEYELEYVVDGVEGEIQINEYTDENGNVFYEYEIEEEGNQSVVEKEDDFDSEDEDEEDDDDDDDDDDEDEDEDEDEEEEELTEEATI